MSFSRPEHGGGMRGRSSVGLERRPVTPEVAGSSPVAPAIFQALSGPRDRRSDFLGRRVPTFYLHLFHTIEPSAWMLFEVVRISERYRP